MNFNIWARCLNLVSNLKTTNKWQFQFSIMYGKIKNSNLWHWPFKISTNINLGYNYNHLWIHTALHVFWWVFFKSSFNMPDWFVFGVKLFPVWDYLGGDEVSPTLTQEVLRVFFRIKHNNNIRPSWIETGSKRLPKNLQ